MSAAVSSILSTLGVSRRKVKSAATGMGFSIHRGPHIRGRALLHTRLLGMELVKRLKDSEGALESEIQFWAEQLAALAGEMQVSAEFVTAPPSSGKRRHHLATDMARRVAALLGLPFQSAFMNLDPRGSRANVYRKLSEGGVYQYALAPTGRMVLVVDDAYCTGMTATRCVEAARGDRLLFLVLCRS